MKIQGIHSEFFSLKEGIKRGISLPQRMSLWGDFANFDKLNYDNWQINLFLLYYYDEIIGGLIYYEKSIGKFLKVGYSPHPNLSVPYSHFFLNEQDSQRATEQLYKEFYTRFSSFIEDKFSSFTLTLPPQLLDVRELIWNKWHIVPNYTYTIDLDEVGKIGLSTYVGKKVRNIIKYSRIEMKTKTISAMDFYTCYTDTYLRQGKKCPKPLLFFQKLEELDNVYFLGAFSNNDLTSGIVICEVNDTAYFVTSGTLDAYHNSNGVTLLLYMYIEKLLEKPGNPIKKFDFAGANNEKVGFFKSNFQPRTELYFTAYMRKPRYMLLKGLQNISEKYIPYRP